jgi:hypothetical protein
LSHCSVKEDNHASGLSIYATAVVVAAMLAPASGAYAQDSNLSVPNVTVTAPAAPVEPPYVGSRGPYFGRYRVEEDKFVEVPCTQTRIAFGPRGKCLQDIGSVTPHIAMRTIQLSARWRSTWSSTQL